MEYDKSEIKSEYLERLLSELKDDKPKELNKSDFIVINPEPGYCIKLYDSSNKKIFINICIHEKMPQVKDIDNDKLIKLLESANDYPDFRIPMSIGEPHSEKDHGGDECVCYDVVINPKFLTKMNTNPTIKGFFHCLCFEGIEDKYKLTLKRDWKILQNKKAHGQIKEQYLRTSSKPLIIDCDQSSNPKSGPLISEIKDQPQVDVKNVNNQRPEMEIVQVPIDGFPEYFVAEIKLPKLRSSRGLELKIGKNRVVLESRTKIYDLDFHLPDFIIPEKTLAEFNVVNKVLTLTMTVDDSLISE